MNLDTDSDGPGRTRVVAAMSGGVDSALAAALLAEQGHEVVGLTFRTHCYSESGEGERRAVPCCGVQGMEDARRVCDALGIRHHVMDVADEFDRLVVQPFCDEYLTGRTPNPCVACNEHIKFGSVYRLARAMGARWVATGHYARVCHAAAPGERHRLLRARDTARDQSYVLWPLTQEALAMTLFPLGRLTKEEVRAEAARRALPVAAKEASQEICFVSTNYRDFLRHRGGASAPEASYAAAFAPGPVVDREGRELGRHGGIAGYTVGQRKGLPAVGEPRYVTEIDAARALVRLGTREDLMHRHVAVGRLHAVGARGWREEEPVQVQLRSHHRPAAARVRAAGPSRLLVTFEEPQRAPTPGQSAVVYRGDEVLAGGVVEAVGEAARN